MVEDELVELVELVEVVDAKLKLTLCRSFNQCLCKGAYLT